MIKSFGSQETEDIFNGISSRSARRIPQNLWKIAARKLDLLNASTSLSDLRIPPANRLESLKGTLSGKYSIRINDQFRLVFEFKDGNAYAVKIMDYH